MPPNPDTMAPDPGDDSMFRRFFQRNPTNFSSSGLPDILRPRRESMLQRLKETMPPVERLRSSEDELTVADAKKILRVLQIEKLKAKLRSSSKNRVLYDEFVELCVEECLNRDQGLELAKALDHSGDVIVLGNVVFLKPQQG
ncbi:hypothetical protein QVD17_36776 [Tagetes erecta]|uniref:Calcium uniporter protein n=1 Tax=Tagetes erecta TaxID=13708 RepID=A0AAD8JVA2_TARER|nr:hypothetical protein QVD17_36776 [Tagetes erecta]